MKCRYLIGSLVVASLLGCATPVEPPKWNQVTDATEAEYAPYLQTGTASISGQAFLTQSGGNVVKAAGRSVTLDPATATGTDWWYKAGKLWVHRGLTPPSANFQKARKTVTADADGRFKFTDLPAGKYYVRTEVTWQVYNMPTQGGVVGNQVEVTAGKNADIVLTW